MCWYLFSDFFWTSTEYRSLYCTIVCLGHFLAMVSKQVWSIYIFYISIVSKFFKFWYDNLTTDHQSQSQILMKHCALLLFLPVKCRQSQ